MTGVKGYGVTGRFLSEVVLRRSDQLCPLIAQGRDWLVVTYIGATSTKQTLRVLKILNLANGADIEDIYVIPSKEGIY